MPRRGAEIDDGFVGKAYFNPANQIIGNQAIGNFFHQHCVRGIGTDGSGVFNGTDQSLQRGFASPDRVSVSGGIAKQRRQC